MDQPKNQIILCSSIIKKDVIKMQTFDPTECCSQLYINQKMSMTMSMINFNELFIVKYKNKKNESIYYFQPRLLFEGKNLCYFDVIENNINKEIFDKCNDNQEYDCF